MSYKEKFKTSYSIRLFKAKSWRFFSNSNVAFIIFQVSLQTLLLPLPSSPRSTQTYPRYPPAIFTPSELEIPGYRNPEEIATDYELATGNERIELLTKLAGEDPWPDYHPVYLNGRPTAKNPHKITVFAGDLHSPRELIRFDILDVLASLLIRMSLST